jgi:hypothetical protein
MNESQSSSQESSKRSSGVANPKYVKPALKRASNKTQSISEKKQSEMNLNPEDNSSQEEELKQEAPKQN